MGSLVLTGDTSGSGTITVPAVAGTFTATIGSATGTHYPFTAGTAVASTSGTSIDFTSIPSWVKRITVMFNGVSTSGTSPIIVQIGSTTFLTSGYSGSCGRGTSYAYMSSGFMVVNGAAAQTYGGIASICLVGSNIWSSSANMGANAADGIHVSGGAATLSGTLDRIRITTAGGTDTFDAGSINILYE